MKKIFALSLSVLLCTVVFAGGAYNTSGISGVAVIERDASTFKLIYKAAKPEIPDVLYVPPANTTVHKSTLSDKAKIFFINLNFLFV